MGHYFAKFQAVEYVWKKDLEAICCMGELWGKNTHSCFIDTSHLLPESQLWI